MKTSTHQALVSKTVAAAAKAGFTLRTKDAILKQDEYRDYTGVIFIAEDSVAERAEAWFVTVAKLNNESIPDSYRLGYFKEDSVGNVFECHSTDDERIGLGIITQSWSIGD